MIWLPFLVCFIGLLSQYVTLYPEIEGSDHLVLKVEPYLNDSLNAKTEHSPCRNLFSTIRRQAFHPKQFFESGAGSAFLPTLKHNLEYFPDILNTRILVFNATKENSDGECSVVYYHIHKNGGTTLERHVPLPTDNYYSKREKALGRPLFEEECTDIMRMVFHQQNAKGAKVSGKTRAFTFLRDPVKRFLSSVAQVLKLRVWHKRLYPCYEYNSTGQLVDCVLEKLETGSFPEMHLAPQSFELYKQVMNFDIEIEVIDLADIGLVMGELGAGNIPKERSTTGSTIRKFPQFRFTMDVMDMQRIHRVCKVYAADVQMLYETKVTETICGST